MTRDQIAADLRLVIVEKQRSVMRRQPPPAFTEEASFADDLGFDSLDHLELIFATEERFDVEVSDDEAEALKTVKDAVDYLAKRLGAEEGREVA